MKYKVGDKVRVRDDLEVGKMYGNYEFKEAMKEFKGKLAIIQEVWAYHNDLDRDYGENFWTDEMLELVAENNAESDENKDESIENTVKSGQFTKEDLKFGDIITVRNGYKYIYIPQENKLFNLDEVGFIHFNDFNDLLKSIGANALDIMKVQRPMKLVTMPNEFYLQLIYERKEDILTEKEKEYLSAVIKPFRDRVGRIYKSENKEYGYFISIGVKDNPNTELPFFKENVMYKGMKIDKWYTLEELGL